MNQYVSFDEAIWTFNDSQSLTIEDEYSRDDIIVRLQACLSRVCPGAMLHPFGSQATGLQTKSSDIDLGFVFPPHMNFLEQPPLQQREMITRVLANLEPELTRNDWNVSPVLTALVPIIKCVDNKSGILVDIAHLAPNSIVNADHIRQYIQIDIRVRPLLLAVKYWAKQRGINEAAKGTLNSFGYCLMLIQYLQVVNPPVLPVIDINASLEVPTRRPSQEELQENFKEKLQFWQKADGSATPTSSTNISSAATATTTTTSTASATATTLSAETPSKKPAAPPPPPPGPSSSASASAASVVSSNGSNGTTTTSNGIAAAGAAGSVNGSTLSSSSSVPVVTATLDESKMKSLDESKKRYNNAMLFETQNHSCVAELLFGFFQFYRDFDINVHCVDTNSGHLIPKNTVPLSVRRSALCILDPSDPFNNVARSVRRWEWQSMEVEFKRACELISLKHQLGQVCFDDLTELVETQEQQYRRIWQKTHVLARVRAEMEHYRMTQAQQHQSAAYQNEQYHREMQNALYRVGLRARHSQTSGSHFTPSNYTPTSDTPSSGHSGQFTPNSNSNSATLAHSPYLSKSPSFHHRSPGSVTPPAVLQLNSPARVYYPQGEMKATEEEEEQTNNLLLPLEPSRSASGSGVPYNTQAYQSSGKTPSSGRYRFDRIIMMYGYGAATPTPNSNNSKGTATATSSASASASFASSPSASASYPTANNYKNMSPVPTPFTAAAAAAANKNNTNTMLPPAVFNKSNNNTNNTNNNSSNGNYNNSKNRK